jgi:surface protein
VVAGGANAVPTQLTTGGPEGLITVSRTGSGNYTLWKNRVPTKTSLPASVPQSQSIYLNAANVSNAVFSASQNTVAYASVGAGLTDSEVYTYYELVDTLQTNLGRSKSTNPNAFITTWDTRISGTGTVSNTSSIVLPLFGTQAITASWGDGTVSLISSSTQVDRTHSYATPGIYNVSITGQGQGFQFNNGGDRNKLMDVGQWGSISGSTSAAFYGCTNLKGTAADPQTVSQLASYFRTTGNFNGYINNWTTSDVSDMLYTFGDATAFNQPIGNWDVRNVTRMSNTFLYATSFNQNIGSWNISKVTEAARMFDFSLFNNGGSPSINNWRPISCSDFTSMFANCPFNQPIGNWPISASSIIMNSMFRNADAFNQNLSSWDVSKVTNMGGMFQDNGAFNNSGSADINNWRPISCSNFSSMFYNASTFNQPIGNWPISASNIGMGYMFSTSPFNQNIGAWDVSKVTAMNNMFQSTATFNNSGSNTINNWRPISCSNFSSMFQSATAFNQPIGNWPLSASSINMSYMFFGASSFNQNVGSWDMSRVTNPESLFRNATAFNNSGSNSINNWNTSNCTVMADMFSGATAFNQPIGNWNVGNVTDFRYMFNAATSFNQDISLWNMTGATGVNGIRFMFNSATSFNQPIGTWDTSKISTMQGTFNGSTAFNQNLGSWLIPSCSNMANMLDNCGMDKINYSATLQGWAAQAPNIKSNVTLGASGRQYDTPGSASRAILTSSPYNWTITGDTFVP